MIEADKKFIDGTAKDHADFLAKFTVGLGRVFGVSVETGNRVADFVRWFGTAAIAHGIKHGIEYLDDYDEPDFSENKKWKCDPGQGWKSEFTPPTQEEIARLWNENERRHGGDSNL